MTTSRQCALEILSETIQKGGYSNLLYKEKASGFDDRDRKLITLLVNDTLANLIHIEYILSKFIGDKKVKPIIKNILIMAIDQIAFLNFPEHAVINESVNLCYAIKKPMLKGFVNGVLRNYVRNKTVEYPKKNTLEYYSVVNSKPLWLMEMWQEDYGFDNAVKYSAIRNSGTVIRFSRDINGENWLKENGFSYKSVDIVKNAYILDSAYGLFETDYFKQGKITIQGIGSMVACLALAPKSNDNVLDACSAPGGKTAFICELMENGNVVACDLHAHRLNLVRETLRKKGFDFVEYMVQDMTKAQEEFIGAFDCVLVDAPCSGLGEINSKPDILLKKTKGDIFALSKIQRDILNVCADYVKNGGTLVYSTCTINKTENDKVVKRFLKHRKEFALDPITLDNGDIIENGFIQFTPDEYEGFFVARFIKDEFN